MEDLLKKLEAYRKQKRISKTDMARLLGANSPQQYANWVYRGSLPKDFYEVAMQILGADTDDLYASLKILKKLERLSPSSQAVISSLIDELSSKDEEQDDI